MCYWHKFSQVYSWPKARSLIIYKLPNLELTFSDPFYYLITSILEYHSSLHEFIIISLQSHEASAINRHNRTWRNCISPISNKVSVYIQKQLWLLSPHPLIWRGLRASAPASNAVYSKTSTSLWERFCRFVLHVRNWREIPFLVRW